MKDLREFVEKTRKEEKSETKEHVQSGIKHITDKIDDLEAKIKNVMKFVQDYGTILNYPHVPGVEDRIIQVKTTKDE
jgi:hypothetical protein